MFKEDDKEVEEILTRVYSYLSKVDDEEVMEIISRVCLYLTRVMFDDLTQSLKESSKSFKQLTENGFKKTLIAIPLEDFK